MAGNILILTAICVPGNNPMGPMPRPFRKAFARIRPGMPVEQAEIEIRREPGGAPPRVSRRPNNWFICLGAERSPWNAEVISLRVRDGRVVLASYSAD